MKAIANLTIFLFTLILAFSASMLAAPGDPDIDFGINGAVQTPVNGIGALPCKMAVQADGKILISGNSFNGTTVEMVVVRYDSDGTIDGSFGTAGLAKAAFGDVIAAATDIAVQPDGKIVVVGLASAGFGADLNFAVARFNSNGTLDTSFDGDGKLTTTFEGNLLEAAFGVAIQPDGKIVAAGSRQNSVTNESWFAVARYNVNGSMDTSFDGDGRLILKAGNLNEPGNLAQDVAVDGNGKIVIAGELQFTVASDFAVVRLNTDGSLDTGFDGDGKVRTSISNSDDSAYAVEIQPDGKIIAAGFSDVDPNGQGNYDYAIARYMPDGSLDPTFDSDGVKTVSFGPGYDVEQAYDIALTSGGGILIAGQSGLAGKPLNTSHLSAVKLDSGGVPDKSFGDGGKIVSGFSEQVSVGYSVAVANDGKILLGGSTGDWDEDTQETQLGVARFLDSDVLPVTRFDYDGDGKADVSVFRPSGGDWYLNGSANGFTAVHFGATGDMPAPADIDGDGKTDIVVFRPNGGGWYWLNSSNNSFSATTFGQQGDLPTAADFDGDGKADIAVFRPSAGDWYRLNSTDGQFVATHFGASEDKPAVGDFNGDGRADISVFRPSTGGWYRLDSATGGFIAVNFGIAEDKPVPADYDGDGKTDICVYRPSSSDWFRLDSSTGNFVGQHWGSPGDKPAAADFDGDGRADITVFRPSDGNWYQLNTTSGFQAVHFGISEDLPTTSAFIL